MRYSAIFWLAISLALFPPAATSEASEARADLVASTARYEFHNNAWLNLHHYLFNLARDHEATALIAHLSAKGISDNDAEPVAQAAAFYRVNLIDKSLLFNRELFAVKRALIGTQAGDEPVLENNQDLETHLRQAYPVYARHIWPAHLRMNQQVLDENMALVEKLEDLIFERIAELSQNQWPDHKVRVDLSYVANRAGAYTTVAPITHAVIRCSGWESDYDWFEILFHEPTHAMIGPNQGAVADALEQVYGRRGLQPPAGLWHGILFYVAGTAVEEALAAEGIEYDQFMFRNGAFKKFHGALRRHMPDYVKGDITLEKLIEKIIADAPGRPRSR